jgi:hypothetical protein
MACEPRAPADALRELSPTRRLLLKSLAPLIARIVGGASWLLPGRARNSADAHVIAVAVELGGGLALTADAEDLNRLAASYRNVMVIGLP